MATFTVRIVLHDADSSEYSVLYEAMNDEEFSDIISSEDGIDYNMPDGEYTISGNYTKSNILEKAKRAIKPTGVKGSVLVTHSNGRTWSNLSKV